MKFEPIWTFIILSSPAFFCCYSLWIYERRKCFCAIFYEWIIKHITHIIHPFLFNRKKSFCFHIKKWKLNSSTQCKLTFDRILFFFVCHSEIFSSVILNVWLNCCCCWCFICNVNNIVDATLHVHFICIFYFFHVR